MQKQSTKPNEMFGSFTLGNAKVDITSTGVLQYMDAYETTTYLENQYNRE